MKIIAFVGMPGSGKTVAADVARKLGFPVIRLGDLTDEELKKQGLERNEKNERAMREGLRKNFGMEVYARRALEKAKKLKMGKNNLVVLDGVKSFEEYLFLKGEFGENFKALCIAVSPETRYERLGKRKERPLNRQECESRDLSELKNLNEGATIAMADHYILNEGITKVEFQERVEQFLRKIAQQKV